LHSAYDTVVVY